MDAPKFAITVDHFRRAGIVNRRKQAASDDLCGFIIPCRIEVGRLPAGDAFEFRHGAGEEFVLVGEGVHALAVGSNRKGIHDCRVRGALDRGQQRLEEGGQLIAPTHALNSPKVLAQLIENDEHWIGTE